MSHHHIPRTAMQPMLRLVGLLGLGLLSGMSPGCGGEGPERAVVRGTVTYQGEPLKEGEIRLVPVEGAKLPSSGGCIVNGRYTIDSKGGAVVGTYKVQIEAYRDQHETATQQAARQSQEVPPSRMQFIPSRYNTNSTLELTITSGSGQVTKDFVLTD